MKRVAAYCRVSTEQDDQLNSLENQKRYFEQYIENNIEWKFCGFYVDEGISGTSVEKRTDFQRMVADAEAHKFDLLLTKEISRFARNTLDSIYYTRKLKGLGIGVYFMNDNINTLDIDKIAVRKSKLIELCVDGLITRTERIRGVDMRRGAGKGRGRGQGENVILSNGGRKQRPPIFQNSTFGNATVVYSSIITNILSSSSFHRFA